MALETSHGPLVGALLDQGFTVYAINPKAVERHRERFRMAGAKSDLRDAWVLATLLRTDRQLYRPLTPDSEVAQELRALTRDRADLVRTRTMLSNQLTACLKAYFPEFLTLFPDPDRPVALALLHDVSNPRAPAGRVARGFGDVPATPSLPAQSMSARRHSRHGCRPRAFTSPRRSFGQRRVWRAPWWRSSRRSPTHIDAYDREIRRVLTLHPDGELYRSLPGAGDFLAARMVGELGDNRDRYQDPSVAQCEAGTAPVTRESAAVRTVHFRRACIHPLRETLWQFAYCSLTHCAWARAYYDHARKRGKKHAEAVRMLGNVWLRIIIAIRRTSRPYEEAVFLNARSRHVPAAVPIVCG